MVPLSTRAPSYSPTSSPNAKCATVVLGSFHLAAFRRQTLCPPSSRAQRGDPCSAAGTPALDGLSRRFAPRNDGERYCWLHTEGRSPEPAPHIVLTGEATRPSSFAWNLKHGWEAQPSWAAEQQRTAPGLPVSAPTSEARSSNSRPLIRRVDAGRLGDARRLRAIGRCF